MRGKKHFVLRLLFQRMQTVAYVYFSLLISILETFVLPFMSKSEVSDSRVPVEMVRTQYNAHQRQVNILHVALVT